MEDYENLPYFCESTAQARFITEEVLKDRYPGDPLPNGNSIRLLQLWTSESGAVTCVHFRTFCLDEVPNYHALSYTWGTAYRNDPFLGFRVTDNLFSALLHLTKPEPQWWWIDALCINQSDAQEKKEQIKLMRRIYSSAKKVYVWLGKPCTTSMELLLKIHKCVSHEEMINDEFKYIPGILERFGLPPFEDPSWKALMKFIARPYFRRVWVIQELVMAGIANVTVACGRVRFSWSSIAGPIHWIRSRQLQSVFQSGRSDLFPDPAAWNDALSLSLRLTKTERTYSMEQLLGLAFDLDSTDPRDKIIALLGLVSEQDSKLFEFAIDYECPVAELFHRLTGTIITQRRSLRLLKLVVDKSRRRIPGLPSWVPDYSLRCAHRYRRNHFLACNGTSNVVWHQPSNMLSFDGRLLDELDIIAEYVPSFGACEEDTLLLWFATIANRVSVSEWDLLLSFTSPGGRDEVGEQFWRCLISDMVPEQCPAPDEYRDHFLAALFRVLRSQRRTTEPERLELLHFSYATLRSLKRQNLLQAAQNDPIIATFTQLCYYEIHKLLEIPPKWELPDTWVRVDNENRVVLGPPGDGDTYIFEMGRTTINTRFFITKSGRMGLGPTSIRRGDRIAIAKGSDQVFVLRKALRYHRLMGECYVDGLMYGQAQGDDSTYEQICLV